MWNSPVKTQKSEQKLTYHQRWYQENKDRILARQKERYDEKSKEILTSESEND